MSGSPLNLRSQERDLIRRALERYKGNRKQTAEALNISTVTLWRKMKEYELAPSFPAGAKLACLIDMRIMVTGSEAIATGRIRAYTEYRMFKSVARYAAIVRTIHVDFCRDQGAGDSVVCAVLVDLVPSGQLKTQARASHPIAAIDKVCDRAGRLLGRRETQSVSS